MAEQDFDINIRTLADLTGIKLTQQQLTALQTAAKQGNQQAIGALKQLADAGKQASASLTTGFTGTAIGIGTIVSVLTASLSKWNQFQEELDRVAEKMLQAQEKSRALGESILDIQEDMISLRRIGAEPLEQSFNRLNQEIIRLKTEQSLLDLPRQGDEWKKLNADISKTEAQLNRVTSAMERQKEEAEKTAKAREQAAEKKEREKESLLKGAVETAAPQVQRALQQEVAARRAEVAGDWRSADLLRKSSENFQRGMTRDQTSEFEQLKKALLDQNMILGQIRDAWR